MTREMLDLTAVEILIFELEFRINLQQDIINAFDARGLAHAEPLKLLAPLQGSLRHARVARELLVQRIAVGAKPELIEVDRQSSTQVWVWHDPAPIQPPPVEGPLPKDADYKDADYAELQITST